jgi:hypothetical protein
MRDFFIVNTSRGLEKHSLARRQFPKTERNYGVVALEQILGKLRLNSKREVVALAGWCTINLRPSYARRRNDTTIDKASQMIAARTISKRAPLLTAWEGLN